jgi:hypothetical protein
MQTLKLIAVIEQAQNAWEKKEPEVRSQDKNQSSRVLGSLNCHLLA